MRIWLWPSLQISADEPLETVTSRLNEFQPQFLAGYPSVMKVLAEEQINGSLRISPVAVLTGAEVLTPETAQRIQRAWGKKPFNQYGTTETSVMACDCDRHKGLHFFEDLVIPEVVDEHYRPVPPGELGAKLLVTVLFRRTQPLIRYELSDAVRLVKESCTCGRSFPLIESIQGRTDDVFNLRSTSGGVAAIHPMVFYRILDPLPVRGWQIVQETDGLKILLTGASQAIHTEAIKESLLQELGARGAVVPSLKIIDVPEIPRGLSGKAMVFKRDTPT